MCGGGGGDLPVYFPMCCLVEVRLYCGRGGIKDARQPQQGTDLQVVGDLPETAHKLYGKLRFGDK